MLLYLDILTNDEILSDSYRMNLVNDVVYEADCQMITEGAVNADIGANASAEEAEEGVDDTVVKFEKKDYMTYLKGYMKAVKTRMQESGASAEEISVFEKGAQEYIKTKVIPNFKDYEFFTGESMSPEGMVVLLNYRNDGITPYVCVWKHGLKEVKV